MNAQLALIPAGLFNSSGSIFEAVATGINKTVLAVLLVVSVKNVTLMPLANIIMMGRVVRQAPNYVRAARAFC